MNPIFYVRRQSKENLDPLKNKPMIPGNDPHMVDTQ